MSGYRDELRAAHDRIAALERELDETRRAADRTSEQSRERVEHLERQVEMLESNDAERSLKTRIEELERTISDERQSAKRDLDNATMRILHLEERQHEHQVDYDRAFARTKELETQLEAARRAKESDEKRIGGTRDFEARIRSLEEQVRVRDEQLAVYRGKGTESEDRVRELRETQRDLEQQLDAARAAVVKARLETPPREETRPETTALAPVQNGHADPDLVRLQPAGSDWAVVHRIPIAARPFRHKAITALGVAALLIAFPVGVLTLNAGLVIALFGLVSLVVGWWRAPVVRMGEIGNVWRERNEHDDVVTGADVDGKRFPVDREFAAGIARGQPVVLEVDGWTGDVLVALARFDSQGETVSTPAEEARDAAR